MSERAFLYIFGYETPLQRRNNDAHGWDDENSHGVLIVAATAGEALAWGDRIAQRYVAELHGDPEVDWSKEGFARGIELEIKDFECPRVQVGEFPDFTQWLKRDRG